MARTPAVDAAREIIALHEKGRLVVGGRIAVQVAEAYLANVTGGCVDGNVCKLDNTQCQWADCRKPISANAEIAPPVKPSADPLVSGQVESDPQLLKRLGMDAEKWCAEMVKVGVVQADPAPGEQFHGWMCNAIMTAYDIGHGAGERRVTNDQMLPLLRMALKMPLPWMIGAKHPKAISLDEWMSAVDTVMAVLDKAKESWVDAPKGGGNG